MSSSPKKRNKKTNKKKNTKNMQKRKRHQHSHKGSNNKSKKKTDSHGQLQTYLSYGVAVILLGLIGFIFYYSYYLRNTQSTITVELEQHKFPAITKYDHSFVMNNKHLINSKSDITAPVPLLFKAKVLNRWNHDINDFTQGLEIFNIDASNGKLTILESTGLYKQSKLKYIELEGIKKEQTNLANVQRKKALKNDYFGEGCTVYFDPETQQKYIYQLTWKKRKVIVYDLEFNVIKEMSLPSEMKEGWGLYYDFLKREFIATDGSPNIYFIEPTDFTVNKKITVRYMNNDRDGKDHKIISLTNLNEIEIVNGWILANVWYNTNIYIISPFNGFVYGIIECWRIFPESVRKKSHAVLNGIAFDYKNNQLIITGKNWPNVFAIEVPPFMMDKSVNNNNNN